MCGGGDLKSVLDDKNVKFHRLKRAGEPVAVRGRLSVPGSLG